MLARQHDAGDICQMVKRRLRDAGLPTRLSPHSFRVATITDLLEQGLPLEDVQRLAIHADPRTTRLYDLGQRNQRSQNRGSTGAARQSCPSFRDLKAEDRAWGSA
jgi:site-specific recombinase XerD